MLSHYYQQCDSALYQRYRKKYDQLLKQWIEKWEEKLYGKIRLLSGKAGIRFFHAGLLDQTIDLYINDRKIVSELPYGAVTNYVQIDEGDHWIQGYPVGKNDDPILSYLFSVRSEKVYTLVLWQENKSKKLAILPFYDPLSIEPHQVKLRFIQLSPEVAPCDLILHDQTVLFRNVSFTEATGYRMLPPGSYTFALRLTGTNQIVFQKDNPVRLRASQVITVVVLGGKGSDHPFQMFFIQDL
jgi:hypothetical protein